jgi:hypothetical protein
MKTTLSQETEDELKYLDLTDGEERQYFAVPRAPLGWRDRVAIGAIAAASLVLLAAVGLGLREEWRIVGRLFQ